MEESLPATIYQDLKDQIPMLVEALKTGAEYGGDLAHRFIMYDIWVTVSYMLGATFFAGLTVLYWRAVYKNWERLYEHDAEIPLSFIGVVLTILVVIFLAVNVPTGVATIIKDIYIPEVRIVEVLNSLLTTTAQ